MQVAPRRSGTLSYLDLLVLSDAQRAAILDRSPNVLVSAGAGSGKTSLLVAYFLHALVDEGVPPQDLVAVTFTRKAATELAARIRGQLISCGRDDLARALDLSTIGTIHSLCRGLIKGHALEALVDPAFSVVEAETAKMMEREVCAENWAETIEAAGDLELEALVRHEKSLHSEIVSLYERLRSIGQEPPRLSLRGTDGLAGVADDLEVAIKCALAAAAALEKPSATLMEKDVPRLVACIEWLLNESPDISRGAVDQESIAAAIRRTAEFFPSRVTRSMEEWFRPVREALTAYRNALAGVHAQPLVQVMNTLLERFHQGYTAAKRERGTLDFADLELRARALVRQGAEKGIHFYGPRARVLVDEFQDTNEVQCAILETLRPAHLLMVGDERQSIYRFRGADVEVFRRREADLERAASTRGGAGGPGAGLHSLADNYRSSEQILKFIDRLFAADGFFGPGFAGLKYARAEKPDAPAAERAVDVFVVEQPEADDIDTGIPTIGQAESEAVAHRVQALLEREHCEPKDIAILTPVLTHARALQTALARRQIESYLVRGKGYYSRDEVADVRALLQVLVNPHDDLSLVTVLRSPLVGLSDDALYLVGRAPHRARTSYRDRLSLWDTICQGVPDNLGARDRTALDGLVNKMSKLATRIGRPGLAGLIDDAVSDFMYDLCVLASEEGDRRFANIRKLMRLADEHESLHGPDLAGFVSVLNEMGDLSDAEGSAPTLAEGENVVRIMTVHQAKGLEFPVVVLTGLGSPMHRDAPPQFVVANDGRAGVFFRGTKNGTYESHDLSWGPAVEILDESKVQERQEDLRLLYVAMTRAKERLVLVGARPRRGDKLDGCHIGWIVSALGFEAFPESGQTIELEGLSAVLASVVPSSAASSSAGPAQVDGNPVESVGADAGFGGVDGGNGTGFVGDEGETCPRFLEMGPPVVLPRRLSFSSLSEFQKCPRRFYLERVVGLRLGESVNHLDLSLPMLADSGGEPEDLSEEPQIFLDEGETNAGRDVGLLVHALLERLPLGEPAPDLSTLRGMAAQIEGDGGAPLAPAHLERAFYLTRGFWLTPVASRPGLGSAGKEVSFCFAREGVVLSGVMDLVWQEGDSWFIADYKTNALLGRSPQEVAAGYDLQSCVYCLAALYAGARQVSMDFLFLEQPEAPVVLAFSPGDIALLEAKLDAVLAEIKKGDFPLVRGAACEGCALDEVCSGLR